jgi:D-alanyl-D-alanine carboxypeptidase
MRIGRPVVHDRATVPVRDPEGVFRDAMEATAMPSPRLSRLRRSTIAAIAAVSLGLIASCTTPAQASAEAKLQKAIEAFTITNGGSPGVVVAIGRGTDFVWHTAGFNDIKTKTPPSTVNQMRMASVAKAFSGAAALSAVTQGKLKLTDTVGKKLPYLPSQWANVTLRQLLNHTSGIPDFSKSQAFKDALVASLQTPPAHRTLLSYISPPTLSFTPGTHYAYSNSDNIIVALMVETAMHRSYESVLVSNVYKPLKLTKTSLPNGSLITGPYMHGYDVKENPIEDVTRQFAAGWTWASGGIVSTPEDAVRFVRGYVSGALFNSTTHNAQFSFTPGSSEPAGPGVNYAGLGLFKYVTSCGTVYGHTGNTSGFTQFIAATKDGTRGVSVAVNAQITPTTSPAAFAKLRNIFELAVCATTAP